MNLWADPERLKRSSELEGTGIYVRAQSPSVAKWLSLDIALLDAPSLLIWLRSQGGDNELAENTVGVLLGHGHLHDGRS